MISDSWVRVYLSKNCCRLNLSYHPLLGCY